MTSDPILYPLLKEFAANNRKHATDAERLLWMHLRANGLGVKFNRQHIIRDYIADFASIERKLVVEVDGGYDSQYEQMMYDANRTKEIESIGFRVLRFKNEEIINNINNVLNLIRERL